jgi:hypothetical protein
LLDRSIVAHKDPDATKGVVEANRPGEKSYGNRNAAGIDRKGLPSKQKAVAEDRIGANVDDSEVSNASETGRTNDESRDEVKPLD